MALNFIYKIESDGIIITNVNKRTKILKIPAKIRMVPVIGIDTRAFLSCKFLKEIRVTKRNLKYTSLNGVLFSKDYKILIKFPLQMEIETYQLPAKTIKIHDYAFEKSIFLKEVILNNNLKYVGNFSFFNCNNISSIIFNKHLRSVGCGSFMSCKNLTQIYFNEKIKTIRAGAFFGCNLSKIKLPMSIKEIHEAAFFNNNNLCSVTCPKYFRTKKYVYDNYIPTSNINIIIKPQLDENSDKYELTNENSFDVFYLSTRKTKIKEIYIKNIENIHNHQFYNFRSVETIFIGDTVSHIGDKAFTKCINLKQILVSPENKNFSDIDGVLCDKEKTRIIHFPANKSINQYIIPDSIITLDKWSFSFSRKLNSVNLNNVITLKHGAFEYSNIKNIIFTDKQEVLDKFVFSGCINLEIINFNTSIIKEVGAACFKNCISLSDIILNSEYKFKTGEYIFENCFKLLLLNSNSVNNFYFKSEYGK